MTLKDLMMYDFEELIVPHKIKRKTKWIKTQKSNITYPGGKKSTEVSNIEHYSHKIIILKSQQNR